MAVCAQPAARSCRRAAEPSLLRCRAARLCQSPAVDAAHRPRRSAGPAAHQRARAAAVMVTRTDGTASGDNEWPGRSAAFRGAHQAAPRAVAATKSPLASSGSASEVCPRPRSSFPSFLPWTAAGRRRREFQPASDGRVRRRGKRLPTAAETATARRTARQWTRHVWAADSVGGRGRKIHAAHGPSFSIMRMDRGLIWLTVGG